MRRQCRWLRVRGDIITNGRILLAADGQGGNCLRIISLCKPISESGVVVIAFSLFQSSSEDSSANWLCQCSIILIIWFSGTCSGILEASHLDLWISSWFRRTGCRRGSASRTFVAIFSRSESAKVFTQALCKVNFIRGSNKTCICIGLHSINSTRALAPSLQSVQQGLRQLQDAIFRIQTTSPRQPERKEL